MTTQIMLLGGSAHGTLRRRLAEETGVPIEEIFSMTAVTLEEIPGEHVPKVVVVDTSNLITLKTVQAVRKLFPKVPIVVYGFPVKGLPRDVEVVPSLSGVEAVVAAFPAL